MKNSFLKPGFEFIFALSLIAILGLPPMLMAQNQDVEIKIQNGDTTVNGKSIKTLTGKNKENAMKDIKHLSGDMTVKGGNHLYQFKESDSTITSRRNGNGRPMVTENVMVTKDSAGNIVETRISRRGKNNGPDGMSIRPDRKERYAGADARAPMRAERRNSQNLTFVNTDINGINTRITYHISDVSNDDLKRMPHIEGARLEINDLNIVPQFSTGKTLILFSLPSKGTAEIKMVDSEGKALWTEKAAAGNFSKSFVMGLNGIYYLQVTQGSGVAVKRIMKEE